MYLAILPHRAADCAPPPAGPKRAPSALRTLAWIFVIILFAPFVIGLIASL